MTSLRCLVALLPGRRPCPDPPASDLGFCLGHLRQAADELARLAPRSADARDARPSSVPYRDLYREPPCEHGDPRGARGCALCRHARASARESA